MVCDTENPSLRAASCCSVDVVNGADGERLAGLVSKLSIVNAAALHFSKNACASCSVLKRLSNSAFKFALPVLNKATTLKAEVDLKFCISLSLSTIKRTATDCT